MALFHIYHLTRYTYSAPVRESANQLKLYAIQDDTQRIVEHSLQITHDPIVETYLDFWGNKTGVFTIIKYHQELKIASIKLIETIAAELTETDKIPQHHWHELDISDQPVDFFDYLFLERFDCFSQLQTFIQSLQYRKRFPLEVISEMNSWIYQEFKYIKGITTIDTTLDEIWKLRAGVCQDFAHLLLAMLRMISIPARYVSGYICPNKNGLRGEGATHAWVEAYLPFHGWVGIDPTNNCLVRDGHVKLAVGRNFADCTPVKGSFKGDAEQVMEVAVSVSYDIKEITPHVFVEMESQMIQQAKKSSNVIASIQASQQQQ